MTSLINLDRYKQPQKQWGGYVLECTKEGAIYIGMTNDLDKRLREHTSGSQLSSRFLKHYGPPVRVLELYFCDTRQQAAAWEAKTAHQLRVTYPTKQVYYPGIHLRRVSIPPYALSRIKKNTP